MTINGKTYKEPELDFNAICDLEELGVNIFQADRRRFSICRAYFAYVAGIDLEDAGKEIEAHMSNGGKFMDVYEAMTKSLTESGFFKASRKALNEETEIEETEIEE